MNKDAAPVSERYCAAMRALAKWGRQAAAAEPVTGDGGSVPDSPSSSTDPAVAGSAAAVYVANGSGLAVRSNGDGKVGATIVAPRQPRAVSNGKDHP